MTDTPPPYRYRVRLRPLTPYFFGQERTFGHAGTVQNYLVRSARWPQQTTLLGTLRYLILQQRKLLPLKLHLEAAQKAIGPRSFAPESEECNDFGIIHSISPLFLLRGEDVFIWQNRGVSFDCATKPTEKAYRFGRSGNDESEGKPMAIEMTVPKLDGYSHKDYYPEKLVKVGKPDSRVSVAEILTEHSQIGIRKRQRGQSQADHDQGFYKQYFYLLDKAYDFGFIANTTEALTEGTFTVLMGGEKSVFSMKVEKYDQTYEQLLGLDDKKPGRRIALLSDAAVSPALYDACDFALLDTVPFRSLEYKVQADTRYNGRPSKAERLYHLARRGSVLYVKDLDAAKKALENPAFQQIGYNHYQIFD